MSLTKVSYSMIDGAPVNVLDDLDFLTKAQVDSWAIKRSNKNGIN